MDRPAPRKAALISEIVLASLLLIVGLMAMLAAAGENPFNLAFITKIGETEGIALVAGGITWLTASVPAHIMSNLLRDHTTTVPPTSASSDRIVGRSHPPVLPESNGSPAARNADENIPEQTFQEIITSAQFFEPRAGERYNLIKLHPTLIDDERINMSDLKKKKEDLKKFKKGLVYSLEFPDRLVVVTTVKAARLLITHVDKILRDLHQQLGPDFKKIFSA